METKEIKLTDVCDFQGGTQPPKEEWINDPQDRYVRMLQIRDFTKSKAEHVAYVKDTHKLNKCKIDDILIGRYGASVGKILTGHEGAYNVAIIKTIPDETKLLKKYLYYVLTGTSFQNFIKRIGARAAQAGFNKDDLSYFKLHLPSLENQERIANILSQSEVLIKHRKQSIHLIEELLRSIFLKLFGQHNDNLYPLERLDDVSLKVTDGEHGKVNQIENGRLYLMARNITVNNTFDLTDVSYISEEAHQKIFKRCNPQPGDLLLVCVGATIGKAALVPEGMEEFSIARSVALIKPNLTKLNSKYLLWFFKSDFGKRQVKDRSNEAAQAGLYTGNIKEIKIPLPTLSLQNEFAHRVTKADEIKEYYKNSLIELEELFSSLGQKAFRGELNIIEKIAIEGRIKIQPKISGEVIAIEKINKELSNFHKSIPHSGAPDDIDNTLRHLDAELKIRGEIPFTENYVKYRLIREKQTVPFTFEKLWKEITEFPFESVPDYDEFSELLFSWLDEENSFIKQQYNEITKQTELVLNETATA